MGGGSAQTLTEDDAKAIATECPAVAAVAPASRGPAPVVAGNANWSTVIEGATVDYFRVRDVQVAEGREFTQQDIDGSARVALLGKTVADTLFGEANPVGQPIRIRKVPFTVIGTLAEKGHAPTGQDLDDIVVVPLSTAKKKVLGARLSSYNAVGTIAVQPYDPSEMKEAEDQVRALLRQRHHLQPGQDDDFTVRNVEEVFAAQEESAQVMSILLAAIASVSLLVGGIGIMNIMLVSVTERTHEIGLRQAVGAKVRDILLQFLVEAVVLSAVGGIIGVALGIAASAIISSLADWSTSISLPAIALAFLSAAAIGVFFGYYPARKAALMNPIEALRYE
jgi:putative ABC transport system permease protein